MQAYGFEVVDERLLTFLDENGMFSSTFLIHSFPPIPTMFPIFNCVKVVHLRDLTTCHSCR
jgi:hypothetical protein